MRVGGVGVTLQDAYHVAIICGVLVTTISASLAYKQFKHNSESYDVQTKLDNWRNAHELYKVYLLKSIENPSFMEVDWRRIDKNENQWSYRQFVTFMLWAIEDILINDGSEEWRNALLSDLRPHVSYLQSDEFGFERVAYFEPVQELINEAICKFAVKEAANA
jgi:hypothetical protein